MTLFEGDMLPYLLRCLNIPCLYGLVPATPGPVGPDSSCSWLFTVVVVVSFAALIREGFLLLVPLVSVILSYASVNNVGKVNHANELKNIHCLAFGNLLGGGGVFVARGQNTLII